MAKSTAKNKPAAAKTPVKAEKKPAKAAPKTKKATPKPEKPATKTTDKPEKSTNPAAPAVPGKHELPTVNIGKQTFIDAAIAERHLISLGFSVDANRTGAGHFVYKRGIGVNMLTATVNRSVEGVLCEIRKGK